VQQKTHKNILKASLQQLEYGQESQFLDLAHAIYKYQLANNTIFQNWVKYTGAEEKKIADLHDFPMLHISAWKTEQVVSSAGPYESVFTSSGTTGQVTSKHYVEDREFYIANTIKAYEEMYGPIPNTCILGLLPSYMERKGSSLVAMVEAFIKRSAIDSSGTYLYDHAALLEVLEHNKKHGIPTLLIGVSFGLLDFVEQYKIEFPELIVMETGGMKGRRKEITRSALHTLLKEGFGVAKVHSEYGMTELLSQAYSSGDGIFYPAPSMRVLIKEINDPMTAAAFGKAGVINIIDLANIDSCAFIATEDELTVP